MAVSVDVIHGGGPIASNEMCVTSYNQSNAVLAVNIAAKVFCLLERFRFKRDLLYGWQII